MIPQPLSCPKLDSLSLHGLPDRLRKGVPWTFQQAWRDVPETDFMPGQVRMGWTPEGFVLWAEFQDRDMFNPVREFNEPAFLKGDVFEIFMRPEGSEPYYEFHITPHNQLFQYRIPSATAFRNQRQSGICRDWLIGVPVVESQTRIDENAEIWQVFARIPVRKLGLLPLKANNRWNFSFCRYDYSQNLSKPTLSSTSPLKKLDFHDQTSWEDLVLS